MFALTDKLRNVSAFELMSGLSPKDNEYQLISQEDEDETRCKLISFDEVKTFFCPLGAQEFEISEIGETLNTALNTALKKFDKNYVKENPNLGESLLEKITELSDTSKPFHAPYELIIESLEESPEKIQILCNSTYEDSPRKLLKEILNSSYEDYGEPYDLAE